MLANFEVVRLFISLLNYRRRIANATMNRKAFLLKLLSLNVVINLVHPDASLL